MIRLAVPLAVALLAGTACAADDPIAAIAGMYEVRLGDAPGCDLVLTADPVDAAKATPDAPHVVKEADPPTSARTTS